MIAVSKPCFKLGKVVATPGAVAALAAANVSAWTLVSRHLAADFGDISPDDFQLNTDAMKDGGRILSAYRLQTGERLWVLTEAEDDHGNRAATTLLLPAEY